MVEAIERAAGQSLLTLGPIVGWRTWEVTPRLPTEIGPPAILRGHQGVAWPGPGQRARCLDRTSHSFLLLGGRAETSRPDHRGDVPAVSCRCGIYAHKPGHGDVGEVLSTVPRVRGWVELAGTVIEATLGYRAQEAVIVGPLELEVPCARGGCNEPAVAVTRTGVMTYRGTCADDAHARRTGGTPVDVWATEVSDALTDRYGVGVVTFI